jgi:superfamily II DNA or RNA helicase
VKRTTAKPATIEILTNTKCQVHGLTKSVVNKLDKAFAMPIPGMQYVRKRKGWDGKKHLFYKDSCTFPKGLLTKVQAFLDEAGVPWTLQDSRKRVLPPVDPKVVKRKGYLLDPTEEKPRGVITFAPFQLKAIRRSIRKQCGILWLATNAGKTECACAIIKAISRKTLVITGKGGLAAETRERIARRFGVPLSAVGLIGESKWNPKNVTVAILNSLRVNKPKPPKGKASPAQLQAYKVRVQKAKERSDKILEYLRTIDVLFVDEGHHAKATTWYSVMNLCPAQYRYILSGTPYNGESDLLVDASVGDVIYRVKNKDLIEIGWSAKPTMTFHEIDDPQIEDPPGLSPLEIAQFAYKQGIVTNTVRNAKIARLAKKYARRGESTLIMVRELWHGDLISSMLSAKGVDHRFVHGQMPRPMEQAMTTQFKEGAYPVLIASSIFDEGRDVPAIRRLIVADGGKSLRAILQKVGRGLRRKKTGANVVGVDDFADYTHRYLAEHSLTRYEIYDAEGFEIL